MDRVENVKPTSWLAEARSAESVGWQAQCSYHTITALLVNKIGGSDCRTRVMLRFACSLLYCVRTQNTLTTHGLFQTLVVSSDGTRRRYWSHAANGSILTKAGRRAVYETVETGVTIGGGKLDPSWSPDIFWATLSFLSSVVFVDPLTVCSSARLFCSADRVVCKCLE